MTHGRAFNGFGGRWLAAGAIFLAAGWPLAGFAANPKTAYFSSAPGAEKIAVGLLEKATAGLGKSVAGPGGNALKATSAQIRLDLVLNGAGSDVEKALRGIKGLELRHLSGKYRRASVVVASPDVLFRLAKLPAVRAIRPEYGAITRAGSTESLADRALRADVLRNDDGLDGAGQTVGVLSDSFSAGPNRDASTSLPPGGSGVLTGSPAQDSGDLPPTVEVLRDAATGSDEGAAMAELIHDIAPRAAIAFSSAFVGGQAGFADGIDQLCARSTVLVDDVLYFAEPMYQPGIVAQAAAQCVASGAPYFSAAGNQSNTGLRARYRDIDPASDNRNFPPTGEDLHAWSSGKAFLPITLFPGTQLTAVLQWNQPFDSVSRGNGSQIDLDMYFTSTPEITAGGGNILAAGLDSQGDTGQPAGDAVEVVTVSNFQPHPVKVYLSIDHFQGSKDAIPQDSATPLEFRIVFFARGKAEIEGIADRTSNSGGPTQYGHSLADGVVSVAAAPFFDTPVFGTGEREFADNPLAPGVNLLAGGEPSQETSAIDPEAFSSRGGELTVFFDAAGRFAPHTSFEPDITAVDGNNTSFFGAPFPVFTSGNPVEPDGKPNFFGTSAAAPNAAAVAALLQQWQSSPGATDARRNNSYLYPAELIHYLRDTAIDITGYRAAPGVDDVTGPGLIDAAAARQRAVNHAPDFKGGPDITVCMNAGNQRFPGWASDIHDGDIGAQKLTFLLENDNPGLFGGLLGFGGQPHIEPNGALVFRGALNASGIAHVSVRLRDDGGALHGGHDVSAKTVRFTITVDGGCDERAGELFNADQFDFDFGPGDNAQAPGFLNGIGDIPLTQSGGGAVVAQGQDFVARVINHGQNLSDVRVDLRLQDYGRILAADPRCEASAEAGAFSCVLDRLPSGATELTFRVSDAAHARATASIRPRQALYATAGSGRPPAGGGGSLGWSLLLLAAWRRLVRDSGSGTLRG